MVMNVDESGAVVTSCEVEHFDKMGEGSRTVEDEFSGTKAKKIIVDVEEFMRLDLTMVASVLIQMWESNYGMLLKMADFVGAEPNSVISSGVRFYLLSYICVSVEHDKEQEVRAVDD